MSKTALICEQCGGSVILDESKEFGVCQFCHSKFLIQQDQLVYNITQNVTKHVYGLEGKDADEFVNDGYRLLDYGDSMSANIKFHHATEIEPSCWAAWLGYASTGANNHRLSSITSAYQNAFLSATTEEQKKTTFVDMVQFFPSKFLRASYIRAYVNASPDSQNRIFLKVKNVLGCDESEMAKLAVDINPHDWNAFLAMASFRKIRAKWCKREGLFSKRLPPSAAEVRDIYLKAYSLAMKESQEAANEVINCIEGLKNDPAYAGLLEDLRIQINQCR